MRMKTRKTHYQCQRKQNLSPNNSYGLLTKLLLCPSFLQSAHQSAGSLVSDTDQHYPKLLLIGGGGCCAVRGRHKPVNIPAWTTHWPFSGKEMKIKSQQQGSSRHVPGCSWPTSWVGSRLMKSPGGKSSDLFVSPEEGIPSRKPNMMASNIFWTKWRT